MTAFLARLAYRLIRRLITRRFPMSRILFALSIAFASAAIATHAYAAPAKLPARATKAAAPELVKVATCRDGKTYYHRTGEHRGACRGHGGVSSWADGSPAKVAAGKTAVR